MSNNYESPASEVLNRGRGLIQIHRPAFWLYAALFVGGAFLAALGLDPVFTGVTVSKGLVVIGTIMFGIAVFWLILQLADLDPKPMSLALAAFLGGAFISTSITQTASGSLADMYGKLFSSPGVVTAFTAATGEEYFKALVVVLIFLIAPWAWRRPLDGIVFGGLVGLGFQIYEDVIYVSGAASVNTGSLSSFTIFFDRVIAAGLYSHAVWTAFFGLGFAYAVTAVSASKAKRIGAAVGGFALAWGGHFLWDFPVLGSLVQGGPLQVILYTILKSSPFLVIFIPLAIKAIKDERGFFHRHAQPEIESGVLTDGDIARLETFGGRIKARREPKGHQAQSQLHHLMRSQLDLVRLHMHNFTEPQIFEAQRTFIEELER